MKTILIIFFATLVSSCSSSTSASKSDTTPTRSPSNEISTDVSANNYRGQVYESDKVDKAQRAELKVKNKAFEIRPPEFATVDFENFTFPDVWMISNRINLRNGKFEHEEKKHLGGTTYSLGSVYYLDIVGNQEREAIVFLWAVSCGGSCDGGSQAIYIYSAAKPKPKLLDTIVTGSPSSGCFIKSFLTEGKKIFLEQFGRCSDSTDSPDKSSNISSCKFCVMGSTKSIFSFKGSKLHRSSIDVFDTPEINIMGYPSEISINN